ncbi:transporter [Desulfonema ishimotonii]|uniref:Transporter n=1 Tax=Desulfonema ishimotonii TaxID=45657 RepID=A0A401FWF8_9BACT|nr:AEC family transporter [Desulfonema ishimotonii]GBC61298.1 transporter [Desulfonema ishimotonii]
MIVLNALFPVFLLIVLGRLLRYYNLTNDLFLKTSDKLVYFIFFPALLFWKIGGARADAGINWHFCLACLCAVLVLYVLSTLWIILAVGDYEAGSFSQSCYRFNTYIGMAIIINALGGEGVRLFGIMVGFAIPVINVLAVSTLIWYSGQTFTLRERARMTFRALISNPLIIACLAGIFYARTVNTFPVFINNGFRLITSVTLPLALLSIGGVLTFDTLRGYFRPSLVAALFKLLIFPLAGYFCLKLFGVSGIPFKVGMIFFALPTSTAIYVLSSQLNSNTELASASVVLSTLLSFVSLSVILVL